MAVQSRRREQQVQGLELGEAWAFGGATESRERWRREKLNETSVASYTYPNWGSNLQPRYVPWPGIESATFWCMGRCSNQLSHAARVQMVSFPSLWLDTEIHNTFWFLNSVNICHIDMANDNYWKEL